MSDIETLRKLAFTFEGTREEYPWGHETPVFKTGKGKIFAMSGMDDSGRLTVTVKLTPDESAEAKMLPFIETAAYVGRFGWVTVRVTNDFEWETAAGLVRRSHELVVGGKKALTQR